jgi:hypothetical protein
MASMLSLADVLPRHERVDIGSGQKIDVYGISGEDIGKILVRYPDAFQQLYNSSSSPTAMDPGLLGAMLAASQRNGGDESLLGNEQVERRGRSLGASDQMKMMQALGRCTFPDGVSPFLEGLASMSSVTHEAIEIVVQAVSRVQDTESPPTPKPSEPQDTPVSGS